MNMRAWFRTVAASVALTAAAWGQTPANLIPESSVPPELAKAVRDRATEFFNYHVKTVNRRGLDLVAEENKDYYYNSQKIAFDNFRLDKVAFAEDLQHATVWGHGHRTIVIQGQSIPTDAEVITTWKIEDGKWVWYLDMTSLMATPMGIPGAQARPTQTTAAAGEVIPSDIASPEKLMAQTQAILQQSRVDKSEVELTYGVKGTGDFTFKNNYTGDVMLELAGGYFPVPGLNIKLEKSYLKPKEEGVVRVEYNPGKELPENTEPQTFTMNLVLQPFNQIFPLKLIFKAPPAK